MRTGRGPGRGSRSESRPGSATPRSWSSSARQIARSPPPAGPLLDATVGVAIGALLSAGFDRQFTLAVSGQAHLWLVALALVSQVMGWLFITTALPRLPAVETSILLLVQPVFAIAWGVMLFAERLSSLQWLGSAIVLAGVATVSMSGVGPATTAAAMARHDD